MVVRSGGVANVSPRGLESKATGLTSTSVITPVNTEEAVVEEIRQMQLPMLLLLLLDPLSLVSPKCLLWRPPLLLQHQLHHLLLCRSTMLLLMHSALHILDWYQMLS
jgi:hypothetical protein